jgi:hypothetical protein
MLADEPVLRAAAAADGAAPETKPVDEIWALVEVFGHRKHYGRVTEVEKFGTKMLRVDVPGATDGEFETFFYGGGSIFGMTPMTEAAARKWAAYDRPQRVRPLDALPPPDDFREDDTF